MGDTAKIVAAAVGGYVLGRRKKFKLALGLGLYLGAKKLDIKPGQLAQGLLKEVSALPVVGELKGQSREQLLNVGRTAAGNIAGKWAGGLADSLNSRTERLRDGAAGVTSGTDEDEPDEDDAARGEAAEDADEPRGDGDAEARQESGEAPASERRTRPKAAKASRGAASGTATRAKGTAKRASGAAKPARRKRAPGTGGKGGDDGRDD
ncbi:hypothetical protein NGM33_05130 [Nocardiopsis dassonvillei]|uniref:hypothetical protein n=1 Tax=Nocardiopsis dassonvillei TaxID=2014 RepID=UPI00102B5AC3|nr:hypothetical protein [Nocardiopsis dassonvillei]MCP3012706.1 hypothetical protein [Nocardiopsis dassonvillei]